MTQPNDRNIAFMCLLAGIVFFVVWEWFGVPMVIRYQSSASMIGLGTTLLLLTLLALLVGVAARSGRSVTRQWWLMVPILLLALDLVWYANSVVLELAPVGVVVLLFALGARLSPGDTTIDGSLIPPRIAWDAFRSIFGIARLPALLMDRGQQRWKGTLRDVVVGMVVALPFLAIFALLFSEANAVFGEFLKNLNPLSEEVWSAIARRIPHAIVALGLSGYLTALLLIPRTRRPSGHVAWSEISPRIAASFFVLLDVLFIAFVTFQGIELFGGSDWLRAQGLTYAAHARRGFFELIIAAGFAGLLALAWYRTIRQEENGRATRFALIAVLTFLALTLLVAISSLQRLWTYGSVYGLTLQRVYATAIVVTTMVGLVVLADHCIRSVSFSRVARHISVLVVIMFTAMMTVPVERIVASWNVSARSTGSSVVPFDAMHIASMSPDAWPALFSLAARDAAVADVVQRLSCRVEKTPYNRYEPAWRDGIQWWRSPYWQSYHLANRVCDRLPTVQAALRAGGVRP
ncbi:DUF4173 domain-containing protein [Candidatus Uhrbacteria bacterium]|nr:DUF4173 domain-containing protein [Candidatus Uhrbacteria bacterium]